MNLYNAIEILKKISLQQPNIRTAFEGSIYDNLNGNNEIKYGVFGITQGNHTQDDNFAYYNFNLFYVDRLTDDESNRVQIQSIGQQSLSNIITLFCDNYDAEFTQTITYYPFTQRFKDECAGGYITVTFQVEKEIYCSDGEYYDDSPAVEIINQNKDITITENGNYSITYDNGYTGLKEVNIDVEVDTTDVYNKGKADGIEEGLEQGKVIGREEAIESLPSLVVNENGTYEGAYKNIEVNVPQTAKISVKDSGIKFAYSTFTTVPDIYVFDGVTDMTYMFKGSRLEYLPEFDFSTVEKAGDWLYQSQLKEFPNINTSGLKELGNFFAGLNHIDTVPAIDCSNVGSGYIGGVFLGSSILKNVGGLIGLKYSITDNYSFRVLDKLTYESCINILNGLYDFVGNGETPNSDQGNLKVNQQLLDTVGDEISIAVSKGWNIYA